MKIFTAKRHGKDQIEKSLNENYWRIRETEIWHNKQKCEIEENWWKGMVAKLRKVNETQNRKD